MLLKCLVCVGSDNLVVYPWQPLLWGMQSSASTEPWQSAIARFTGVLLAQLLLLRNTQTGRHVSFFDPVSIPLGKCHAETSGVLLACYSPGSQSPVSPFATSRIHTLMTDTFDVGSRMPFPVSQCHFGFMTSHVGRKSPCDISPKGQTQEQSESHAGQSKCSGAVVLGQQDSGKPGCSGLPRLSGSTRLHFPIREATKDKQLGCRIPHIPSISIIHTICSICVNTT